MILTPVPQNSSQAGPNVQTYTAGETISGHTVVELIAGKIYKAQLNSDPDSIVGFTTGAVSINAMATVQSEGILNGFGSLVQDAIYFLSNNGTISITPAAAGLLLKVGVAFDSQNLIIRLSDGVIRN